MTKNALTLGALLAGLIVGPVYAQGGSPPAQNGRAPHAGPPSTISPSMIGFGDREPACLAWSDGCVACLRSDKGEPAPICSNIGISCQSKDIRCTKRNSDAPK